MGSKRFNSLLHDIFIKFYNIPYEDDKIKSTDDESKLEDVALTVKRILDMINTIQNDEIKLYLINKLILFDGITIHKKIYSKTKR